MDENKQNCDNCKGRFEDNNSQGVWEECRNPNSKYYYENINNVDDKKCDKWLPNKPK